MQLLEKCILEKDLIICFTVMSWKVNIRSSFLRYKMTIMFGQLLRNFFIVFKYVLEEEGMLNFCADLSCSFCLFPIFAVLTVCSCHVTYAFQSEFTLYSCLNVKELLAESRCKIWRWSDCNWNRTQNHLVRGSGFDSSCSHFKKTCLFIILQPLSKIFQISPLWRR